MGAKFSRLADIVNKRRKSDASSSPETGHDPAVHGAKLEDRFYNNDSFKSPSVDPSNPQQQDAALTIQTNYRQHAAKQEVQGMREEEAAVTIQAGVRGFIDRQKVLETNDPEEFKRRQEEAKERLATKESAAAQEEEVDIDLTDPDVEKAAIKIQAGFKGFKARKGVQEVKSQETEPTPETKTEEDELADIDLTDPELASAATKIQASFRGHKTRKDVEVLKAEQKETETVEETRVDDELADIDLNDPEVANAAVKIQAGFRGHMARKNVQKVETAVEPETTEAQTVADELADIDLNDPDVANAAVKIQAGFRGHMARKNIQTRQTEEVTEAPAEEEKQEEEIDIDLNDPEVEKAATKIQASFKGHKARMEVKAKKETQQAEEEQATEEKPEEKPQEEEIDIDLDDPNTEKAAVMIQSQFRGFKTRKEIQAKKASSTEEEPAPGADKKQEEEEVDIDLTDPEVEKAAVKIQSGFKGYKARKELKKEDESQAEAEQTEETSEEKQQEEEEEEVDIDLNDPEVEKAALKIQAGFKGFKARKDGQDKKEDEQ